jgi:cobalamin-dependent methionine synthase I
LEKVGRVFPYVITIGTRLEQKADASKDLLEKYYLDKIGNIALSKARKHLEDYLRSKFAFDGLSYMSPGSLADWPIEEQQPLFSILKGAEVSIGVRLTESLLMIPRKSVSGIYFPTEVTFYSCQLCSRQHCEGRKARFNENLAKEYGILK